MRAYKFLAEDGTGRFSRFRWPLPDGGPGAWVEAEEADPCRSGVHACRPADLAYWLAPALHEIELGGNVVEQPLKVVASRGRLVRRVDAWDAGAQADFARMCAARAAEVAASAARPLAAWPPAEGASPPPALAGFMAARIAEELGGVEAHRAERERQSAWLAERLGLGLGDAPA